MRALIRSTLPLLVLAACGPATASAPVSGAPGPNTEVNPNSSGIDMRVGSDVNVNVVPVSATVERAWETLPGVYQEIGIPVALSDPSTRQFGNRRVPSNVQIFRDTPGTYVRCGNAGSGPSAVSSYRVTLSVVTQLQPRTDGKTGVFTQVSGTAAPADGSSRASTTCVSNGRLEQVILAAINRRLQM